jgi:hypothetical protein
MTDWKTGYFIVDEDYFMNRILPQHVGAGFSRHVRAEARTHMGFCLFLELAKFGRNEELHFSQS